MAPSCRPRISAGTRGNTRILGLLLLASWTGCSPEAPEPRDLADAGLAGDPDAGRGGRGDSARDTGRDLASADRRQTKADASSATASTSFTCDQIGKAAQTVKKSIEVSRKLPADVTVNGSKVTMPQLLRLLVHGTLELDSGSKGSIALEQVASPTSATETVTAGSLSKSEYLALAQTVKAGISSTGSAPGNVDSALGKIRYETLVYLYSKVLDFYLTNQRLPNTVSVEPWAVTSAPIAYATHFVKPTSTYAQNSLTWGGDWSAWGKCSVCGAGYRHCGVDVDSGAVGREVVAVEAGVVKWSEYQTEWNRSVILEHTLADGSKMTSLYYHLANVTVKAGAGVSRGQKLGTISATYSYNSYSAPHLHFGLRLAPYSSTMSPMGALPTCSHAGYSFPEKFVDPTAFLKSHP